MRAPGDPLVVFVLASANKDKAEEMAEILAAEFGPKVELRGRPDDLEAVEETGETLEDNARLKARAVNHATGLGVIADDTGLEVAALGGRPGVRSARFAGPEGRAKENIDRLLSELTGVADRRARFRTVALALTADGTELIASGTLDGTIAFEARGSGGFGYDPVFVPNDAEGRTLAEMDATEKNAISHRGRALRALAEEIRSRVEALSADEERTS